MKHLRIPLRVVLYRDGERWLAHCLEFDLLGDGDSTSEAIERLTEAVDCQVQASLRSKNWRNLFKPADGRFFEMFAAGTSVAESGLHLQFDSITIDSAETREYTDSEQVAEVA